MTPTISVVIPAYNAATTLTETLDSVLKQTFTDFEVIVINDGSRDETAAIAQSTGDARVRLVSQDNVGLAATRNRGIQLARSEYISFIDADDLWTPEKLAAQWAALEAQPAAAIAYSWTDYIDESGRFLYPGSHQTCNGDVYAQLLVHNFFESGSNVLARKAVLVEMGGFDETLPSVEDWDLWLRIAARYPIAAVAAPQVLYRVASTSMSANLAVMERCYLQVMERGFARAPAALQELRSRSLARMYEYLTFRGLAGRPRRPQYRQAARHFALLLRYDPGALRRRTRLMAIVAAKIARGNLLGW